MQIPEPSPPLLCTPPLAARCSGLSASLYTTLYMATFEPDVASFLLLLALLPPLLVGLAAFAVNVVPYVEDHETAAPTAWLSTEGRCGLRGRPGWTEGGRCLAAVESAGG